MFLPIIEAAVLASSLSVDALTAGFAYGAKKIRVPFVSAQVINAICCAAMGLAFFIGDILMPHMPAGLAAGLGFIVLFVMGLFKLADGLIKALINKYTVKERGIRKAFRFTLFQLQFILHLYANPEAADKDVSAHISPGEAVALGAALSLDGVAVGFAAALAGVLPLWLIVWSFTANFLAMWLGQKFGYSLADRLPFNISWVSGVVLIGLAFSRLWQ